MARMPLNNATQTSLQFNWAIKCSEQRVALRRGIGKPGYTSMGPWDFALLAATRQFGPKAQHALWMACWKAGGLTEDAQTLVTLWGLGG